MEHKCFYPLCERKKSTQPFQIQVIRLGDSFNNLNNPQKDKNSDGVLCIELFLLLCLYIVDICVSEIDTNSHYHQTKARQ